MSRPVISRFFPLALCVALALPSVASAAEVVLAPLVPRGATNQQVSNITSLIASELDFSSSVDKVIEIDKTPPTLNSACLASAACLSKIGRAAGGDSVITGSLRMTQNQLLLELVYYDISRGRFVRRLSFELPNQSEVIADNMDDIVRELLTGEAPKKEAAADAALADDFDFDEDEDDEIDFDEEDFTAAAADEDRRRREAEAAERRATEERERRQAEQAERERREAAEAERRRREAAEAERKRREAEAAEQKRREAAEAERRRREAEEAADRRREEEAADRRRREAARLEAEADEDEPADEEEEFDPNAFSFGGGFGGGDIVVEDAPDEDKPVRTPTARTTDYYDDDEEDDEGEIVMLDDDDELEDLDEPDRPERVRTERVKPTKEARPTRDKPTKAPRERVASTRVKRPRNDEPTSVQIALRGGFSPYYVLGFITTGAEASVALGDSGLHVVGGVEAWSVNRSIPERFQAQAQAVTEWNFLVPINVGATYKLDLMDGAVRPYFGADLVMARYYVTEEGKGRFSAGPRARAGADLMFVRNFGLNVNVAMGFWSGKDWVIIEKDVQNSGLLPQISAGTVLAF